MLASTTENRSSHGAARRGGLGGPQEPAEIASITATRGPRWLGHIGRGYARPCRVTIGDVRVPVASLGVLVLVIVAACSYHGRPLEDVDAPGGPGADAPAGADAPHEIDAPGTPDAPPPPVDATTLNCPGNYIFELNGHRYRVGTGTWFAAETSCEADGQHLVVIDDFTEFVGVDGVTTGPAWIGMSDHAEEGHFRWLTNGNDVDSGWKFGEPSNSGNTEDCGALVPGLGAGYNDDDCTRTHDYVCECDGEVVMPLWCTTGTDTNCNECGDNCTGGDHCSAQQCN